MIYSYKRKKELEELYENNSNELVKIFLKNGFPENMIIDFFNYPKDNIIDEALNLMCYENHDKDITEFYTIPKKYKKAEYHSLQKDRNSLYNEMNNSIDKLIGETLQSLYDYGEDEYLTGIHITGAFSYNQGFDKGIPTRGVPDIIDDHVLQTRSLPFMLSQIKHCEKYKFSKGAFIIKIPKKSIGENTKDAKPLYYKDEKGQVYLRPEFIVAYVPVLREKMCDVYMNDYPHDKLYNEETEFYYARELENSKSYGFINVLLTSSIVIIITLIVLLILK